jgi:hypothetical protein
MLHCRLAALMAAETPFTYDTQLASLQFTYKGSTVITFALHSRLVICLSAKFAYKHATVLGSPQCWPAGNGCVTDTCQLLAICMVPPALDICLAYNQSHDNPFPYSSSTVKTLLRSSTPTTIDGDPKASQCTAINTLKHVLRNQSPTSRATRRHLQLCDSDSIAAFRILRSSSVRPLCNKWAFNRSRSFF